MLKRALDFIYAGEVMIPSEELTSFVTLAESLEIRGLQGSSQAASGHDVDADRDEEDGEMANGEEISVAADVEAVVDGLFDAARRQSAKSKKRRLPVGHSATAVVAAAAKKKRSKVGGGVKPVAVLSVHGDANDEAVENVEPSLGDHNLEEFAEEAPVSEIFDYFSGILKCLKRARDPVIVQKAKLSCFFFVQKF
jgi:hypothetical protein